MNLRPIANPPNPYESRHAEWLEPAPPARMEIYEETSGSILSENDSPDLPFRWSVNPYRGCQHACAYCYARPYHEYLGLGAGTDFETKLVVKTNAAELLAEAFRRRGWRREAVNFSGITDCYQPVEASYEITRKCLGVCLDFRNPAMVVTKGYLVARDADLLAKLHQAAGCGVYVSIPFADGDAARRMEPFASSPERRFLAIRRLRDAGVPVGVLVAPIIPGLNDTEIPEILERAAEAGAQSAGYTALRLPGSVEEVFCSRLREEFPMRADRVLNRLREIRGGRLNDPRFGKRMRGEGVYWESVRDLFSITRKRLGLDKSLATGSPAQSEAEPVDAAPSPFGEAGLNSQLTFGF